MPVNRVDIAFDFSVFFVCLVILRLIQQQRVGWLFWIYRPFETIFQSISDRLPERGRKKREVIDERKNVQTTLPSAPIASAIGPCPTIIKISRTPSKFIQHLRTTRPPPAAKGA